MPVMCHLNLLAWPLAMSGHTWLVEDDKFTRMGERRAGQGRVCLLLHVVKVHVLN